MSSVSLLALLRLRPLEPLGKLSSAVVDAPSRWLAQHDAPLGQHAHSQSLLELLNSDKVHSEGAQNAGRAGSGSSALQLRRSRLLSGISGAQQSSFALQHATLDILESIEDPETGSIEPLLCVKRTYQPSITKRKRTHGFMVRVISRGGRKILRNRIKKGRWRLAV